MGGRQLTGAVFDVISGDGPLLISVPHAGMELTPGLAERLSAAAQSLPDTDWHVPKLYEWARALKVSFLIARYSRYVIDLNRPPDGKSLYPGQATTELCPTVLFDGTPLYRPYQAPTEDEIAARRERYWQPYHAALQDILQRNRIRHGYALLYDAHSIRSRVPRLFDGALSDLNIGTAKGVACSAGTGEALLAAAQGNRNYSAILNGRFIGGYITRYYGQPENAVEAVQMELAQKAYMQEEAPYAFDPAKALPLQKTLRAILETFLERAHNHYSS